MHVKWSGGIPFFQGDMRGSRYKLSGEAPVVDLGGGWYLFALLTGMDDLARQAIVGMRAPMSEAGSKIRGAKGPITVPPKLYPRMVTFQNKDDPMSVKEVKPDNLSATFGGSVNLKSVTLEIVEEQSSDGKIKSLLSWLGPNPEPKLGPATGGTTNIPFYRLVSFGDFLRK